MKSNLLKAERIKLGMTQKEISSLLNIDNATFSKKENGIIDFKASEINALKQILKLSPQVIDEIFFDIKLEFNSNIIA